MRKIRYLFALKREFDGYDRWSRGYISMVDFEDNIQKEKARMEIKVINADETYHDIQVRDATTEEIQEFLSKKINELQSNNLSLQHARNEVNALERYGEHLTKEITDIQNILK